MTGLNLLFRDQTSLSVFDISFPILVLCELTAFT